MYSEIVENIAADERRQITEPTAAAAEDISVVSESQPTYTAVSEGMTSIIGGMTAMSDDVVGECVLLKTSSTCDEPASVIVELSESVTPVDTEHTQNCSSPGTVSLTSATLSAGEYDDDEPV